MSDDAAPAFDEQDQPIDATDEAPESQDQPVGSDEESSTDFDPSELSEAAQAYLTQREKEMQGDYTKKSQTLAEERRELAEWREWLKSQGGQEEDEEDPEGFEYDDPNEKRLAQLEQQLAANQVRDEFIDRVVGLEESEGRELSKAEHNALWKLVQAEIAMSGEADVDEIWAEMKGLYTDREKAAEKKLLAGKTDSPRPPQSGKPGSRQVDLSNETPDERRARMLDQAERAEASASA